MNTSFQKFNFSIESEIGNDHYQKQFSRQFALEHALLLLLPSTIEEAPFIFLSSSWRKTRYSLFRSYSCERTVSIAISELRHKQTMREYPVASLVVIRFSGMNGKKYRNWEENIEM